MNEETLDPVPYKTNEGANFDGPCSSKGKGKRALTYGFQIREDDTSLISTSRRLHAGEN